MCPSVIRWAPAHPPPIRCGPGARRQSVVGQALGLRRPLRPPCLPLTHAERSSRKPTHLSRHAHLVGRAPGPARDALVPPLLRSRRSCPSDTNLLWGRPSACGGLPGRPLSLPARKTLVPQTNPSHADTPLLWGGPPGPRGTPSSRPCRGAGDPARAPPIFCGAGPRPAAASQAALSPSATLPSPIRAPNPLHPSPPVTPTTTIFHSAPISSHINHFPSFRARNTTATPPRHLDLGRYNVAG